jgi:hypothetical protein
VLGVCVIREIRVGQHCNQMHVGLHLRARSNLAWHAFDNFDARRGEREMFRRIVGEKISPEQRREIAKKAAQARWAKTPRKG